MLLRLYRITADIAVRTTGTNVGTSSVKRAQMHCAAGG